MLSWILLLGLKQFAMACLISYSTAKKYNSLCTCVHMHKHTCTGSIIQWSVNMLKCPFLRCREDIFKGQRETLIVLDKFYPI